ncbi:uncharacterized protein Dvar_11850 [Desulfosarcina variabilis str. Montpellier]|uniref:tetratricopeptide repeat protein n=1 Tax=Desulfosarcina variabilis TaxID=2300 RepID=UPI003AFB7ED8
MHSSRTKRKILFFIILFLLLIGGGYYFFGKNTNQRSVTPELASVGKFDATVAWQSADVGKGRVSYRRAGVDEKPMTASDEIVGSPYHRVLLKGLRPNTRYSYSIEGVPDRFQFQTQPLTSSPFSFLILDAADAGAIEKRVAAELPDFILVLENTAVSLSGIDAIRPSLPVFNMKGPDSPFLRAVEKIPGKQPLWTLDWGGLRCVFINDYQDALPRLKDRIGSYAHHTIGIFLTPTSLAGGNHPDMAALTDPSGALVSATDLHKRLTAHNADQPQNPVAFVALIDADGKSDTSLELDTDDIHYFSLASSSRGKSMRVDVEPESVRAFFLDQSREIALKSPPHKKKITCEECRRLADKGAYEASIQAYKDFIAANKVHYQIEDAIFAIAKINDEKLFAFQKALHWYQRLIDQFPESTLAAIARQRTDYLVAHGDYGFEPLKQFEQIKKVEFARKKDDPAHLTKILEEVRALVARYPDSALAPDMQHWLAYQYRAVDTQKAVDAYDDLKKAYPDSPNAREVMLEIGNTYYRAGHYRTAARIFRQARAQLSELTDTIDAKIKRSQRNQRRVVFQWVSLTVVLFGAALLGLCRRVVDGKSMRKGVALFFLTAAVFFLGAYFIREQFNSMQEMILIALFFSASAAISAMAGTLFSRRIETTAGGASNDAPNDIPKDAPAQANPGVSRIVLARVSGSMGALILFTALCYLSIYHIYIHYLIIFKL